MGILMLNGNNYTGGIQQVYGSSSGNIATFDDGGDNKPLKSLKVAINPVQSGSGEPSPQNVRPISGWSSVNVTDCGKNFFNPSKYGSIAYYTINSDGSITVVSSDGGSWNDRPIIPLKAGTYTVSYIATAGNLRVKTSIDGYSAEQTVSSSNPYTFTLSEDGGCKFKMGMSAGTYPITVKVQLEMGSRSTTWTAYNGTTTTIQLGDTYYGGELDVKSGVLRVDRKLVDLGSMTYAKSSSKTDCFASTGNVPEDLPLIPSTTTILKGICSQYKPTSVSAISSGDYAITYRENFSNNGIMVKDSTYHQYYEDNDMQAFQQAMDGVQLVYKLATPLEIQLTPTEVKTLLGNNNIWSDTGDITECVYQRDLNLVINQFDARITALEQALNSSGTRSLSLSKSAVKEEETEEITEEPKEEEQNEDKR